MVVTTLGDGVVVGFVEVGGVVVVEESVAAVGEVAELADVVDRVVAGLEAVLGTLGKPKLALTMYCPYQRALMVTRMPPNLVDQSSSFELMCHHPVVAAALQCRPSTD